VEWIGSIPTHWEVASLSKLFSIKAGGDVQQNLLSDSCSAEFPYPIYTNANSESAIYGYTKKANYPSNTITVSGRGDIGFAVYRNHAYDAIIRLLVLAPLKRMECKFFAYFINTVIDFKVESSAIGQLSTQQISPYKSAIPSLKEQKCISAFLNHETTKIDSLIEKQQQLIELLKEKRQAVISHAVTKGLNPDAPMKDSGVEWLGEVPEHWFCTKIKHIALLTPKKSAVNYKLNDECTFIPMEKLKRNSLVTDESKFIREVINGYTYFEDNDLLLAKVTPCFENKNITVAGGLINGIGFGSTEIYVLRPTEKVRVNYLLYRLQEDNFMRAATGAMTGAGGLKRVPSDFLLNYSIAIPPKSEMDVIVDYLSEQESHYDLIEKNAMQGVQLLQERRTALISAAVTGKIDVRNWVAPEAQKAEVSQEATA
jgi:type I restriction enzyme S subunit